MYRNQLHGSAALRGGPDVHSPGLHQSPSQRGASHTEGRRRAPLPFLQHRPRRSELEPEASVYRVLPEDRLRTDVPKG